MVSEYQRMAGTGIKTENVGKWAVLTRWAAVPVLPVHLPGRWFLCSLSTWKGPSSMLFVHLPVYWFPLCIPITGTPAPAFPAYSPGP